MRSIISPIVGGERKGQEAHAFLRALKQLDQPPGAAVIRRKTNFQANVF
jgi:hypothetical protein